MNQMTSLWQFLPWGGTKGNKSLDENKLYDVNLFNSLPRSGERRVIYILDSFEICLACDSLTIELISAAAADWRYAW